MPGALSLQSLSGAVLGLSAGLAPGPLLALVISQTFTYGKTEGIKIALCPLFTDPPIILFSALAYISLTSFHSGVAIISLLGAGYLFYLGYQTMRISSPELKFINIKPHSFQKGMLANLLNPHPYLFWLSVGLPMFCKPKGGISFASFVFIFNFYLFLIGSKIGLAVLLARWSTFVQKYFYFWAMKILGLALFGFALHFMYKALTIIF